ncbi:MAG: hybrid sensor histidine kinase/response regulator [Planctomycetes bacterium]|nr:hybrid sensor histidine kinase/response regulator [Planctomycetota bacterium]
MSPPAQAPLRLLIVEDDPVYERILRAHLGRLGDRVGEIDHAGRVEDGLRQHRASPADLVLLDLTLPDSLPEATLERVAEFAERGAAVLVLSALDDPEVAEGARAAGALGFLDKGKISSERLAEAMDKVGAHGPAPQGAAPEAPPRRELGPDHPQRLAAQLVHDGKSWLTNHSFRLAALKRAAGPEAEGLIEGLGDTARALADLLDAGRGLVVDETTPVELLPVDLAPWVAAWKERRSASGGADVRVQTPDGSSLLLTCCPAGLEVALGALVENAEQAAGDGPVVVDLRATVDTDGSVQVEVTDSGGSWGAEDAGRLTDAFQKVERGSTRAGLGLYRARRWMERMGGSLDLVPREDTPGAMTVRLRFRAA